ncbi:GAF domain-containing protein [Pantanalinema rosaneae CENA516]|uniref:sensor histidine kinase n=1 Tax=Pantanalinema rosaneae TaxID=1620701 RepID=UPI003D70177F
MNHLILPGQVIWQLPWSDLISLLHRLPEAVATGSRLQAVIIGGEDVALCQTLQQIWQQAVANGLKQTSPSSAPLTSVGSHGQTESLPDVTRSSRRRRYLRRLISKAPPEQEMPPIANAPSSAAVTWASTHADSHHSILPTLMAHPATQAITCQHLVCLEGVEAGILLVAAHFQVWLELRSPPTPKAIEPVRKLPTSHSGISSHPLVANPELWQVELSLDPQRLAMLLVNPVITAIVPQVTSPVLDPDDQTIALKVFWAHLLKLFQVTAPFSAWFAPSPPIAPSSTPPATRMPSTLVDELFLAAPVGMVQLALDGSIMRANPAFCQLTGYREAQLRHLDNRAISYPEDFAAELRVIQQLVNHQVHQPVLQKRYWCSDGSLLWTEVKLSLVGDPEAEDSYLLSFVTDLSIQKQAEQEIHQRREWEGLLNDIAAQIRTTLDLQVILQGAVERLRQVLDTDRVLVYQMATDGSGCCTAEAVTAQTISMLGQSFPADCMPPPSLTAYRQGRLWKMADLQQESLAECHRAMLEQVHVRSMIATAILSMDETLEPDKRTLWGLLVVHHCRVPRSWTIDEQQLVQAVANQIAIALEQTRLLQQLKAQTQELEDRVHQRTRSLEQSLQFEQLIRTLTESLRQDLDENHIFEAAVEGVRSTLNLDICWLTLLQPQPGQLKACYTAFSSPTPPNRIEAGKRLTLTDLPLICQERLQMGQSVEYVCAIEQARCWLALDSDWEAPADMTASPAITLLMNPIMDTQGLEGVLILGQWQARSFEPTEIKLLEQVTHYCAIALRQNRLYHQEHEQRLSAQYFRLFLEKSIDVFVEYDPELRYISINPAGSVLLGRSQAEVIGKTNRELLGGIADAIEPLIQQAFATGEKVFVNHEVSLPQGTRVFETIYAPILNPVGIVQRVIGVSRDVTELKQQWQLLEHQNQQLAETTRLKQEFVATTSHELRTPLTAILGFSNVLLQEFFGELNLKQKDYIERIHASGQHLLDLINDILDLSRLEADRLELELQTIFVPDVCEGVISLIQERVMHQGLTLQVDIAADIEWMVADPRRLKQMLLNLLTNAVKFTPKGAVGLQVYRRSHPVDDRGTTMHSMGSALENRATEMIHFLVWDTGIGIDEADQRLLFAPFSQIDSSLARKHQGSGLGLVITRKLAELHGGTVTLRSRSGQGAQFTVSLPLQQSA